LRYGRPCSIERLTRDLLETYSRLTRDLLETYSRLTRDLLGDLLGDLLETYSETYSRLTRDLLGDLLGDLLETYSRLTRDLLGDCPSEASFKRRSGVVHIRRCHYHSGSESSGVEKWAAKEHDCPLRVARPGVKSKTLVCVWALADATLECPLP